jgi:hypothetical protein
VETLRQRLAAWQQIALTIAVANPQQAHIAG